MKKISVVRQNRCDKEMNVLLFGCFFLYFAMQLFIGRTEQQRLVNAVNMLLYLVFVPGFLFRAGYCFGTVSRLRSEEQGRREIGRMALQSYGCYLVLAVASGLLIAGYSYGGALYVTLTFTEIPGIAAVFFAVALAWFASLLFYPKLKALASREKKLFLAAGILALCALLRARGETYALVGALTGADTQPAVPVVPYFAYFLFGLWTEEKKPGFQWKLAGIAAAVTAVSALLYGTPLQSVCRVLISALPVYLVYVVSELLSDVTLRWYAARFVADTVEPVFLVYAAGLLLLRKFGFLAGAGVWKVLAFAVCVIAALYAAVLFFWAFSRIYERLAKLFEERVKHKTACYFLIYTVVFVPLFALAFLAFPVSGRTLLWQADTVSQYYPRAVYFVDYIRDLVSSFLSGNFELPMYDFRLGFGGEVTYSLEPLYFLFALFGREHVEFTYCLLVFLRFYLAGITSSIFCLYFKKDYVTTFVASCVYVFCGFSFFGGARHTMFMIQMILFPLLILAIEEILRKRRWYLCTIFVAVSLLSNYYFLYMSTIGMGIYFLVRFFCREEKEERTVKNFFGRAFTICGSYLLGAAMSCIVLATTFGLYVGSGRSGSAVIQTPSLFFYQQDWLVRLFLTFPTTANSPGQWLKLGFLPIAFLAVVFLFGRKGRKELKLLSVISVILMAFPLFAFIFSGFSTITNRWCYMVALLVAYIVADCLPQMREMTAKDKRLCVAVIGLYGCVVFFGYSHATRYMKLAFVFLAATYAGLMLMQKDSRYVRYVAKQSILILMTVVMVFANGYLLFGADGVVTEYMKPGATQRRAENTPLRAVSELGDDSFYRSATPQLDYSTISSSIMFDYNTISMFNSTLNGSIMEYLEQMGSTGYSVTQLFGLSNRTFLNALAAVKYYAYYDEPARPLPYGYEPVLETELDGKRTTVCENQYALPLGYTYSEAISEEELEQYDVLERQEVLMQRVMLKDADAQGTDGIASTLTPLEYTITETNRLRLTEDGLVAGDLPAEDDSVLAGDDAVADDGAAAAESDAVSNEDATAANSDGAANDNAAADGYFMRLEFEGKPNSETYVVLKNAVLKGNMSEASVTVSFYNEGNKLTYKFRPDDDRYGTRQQDYVFNLGYHENAITSCEIRFSRADTIRCDSMELYAQPMQNYAAYTEALTEDVLEKVEIGTNEITGAISLDEDKYLVLSIPYQNGWTAYVDGEEVGLQRANYMYMALPLSAGEHTVRLTFEIPAVKYALVIMPCSVVLFIGLLVLGHVRRKRAGKKSVTSGNTDAGN